MIAALSEESKDIISCAVQDAALYRYIARKVSGINAPGGLASLTGMGIWELGPLLPLIAAPHSPDDAIQSEHDGEPEALKSSYTCLVCG